MPEVTVVIPSFNHEQFIASAISSALDQSYDDLEVIVLDDCSSDGSRLVIERMQRSDSRIRAIFHDKNMGIAATLNQGIDLGSGTYVAFLASDDMWTEDKIERQLRLMESNEDLVVWSEGEIIDENGCSRNEYFTVKFGAMTKKKSGRLLEELLLGNFILPSSAILRREIAGRVRFDENLRYLNDHKFFVDLAGHYEFAFISQPLTKYRLHRSNTIFSDRPGWCRDTVEASRYFITVYGNRVTRKARARTIGRAAVAHSCLDERLTGLQLACRELCLSPFDLESILDFGLVLTSEDGLVRSAFKKLAPRNLRRLHTTTR